MRPLYIVLAWVCGLLALTAAATDDSRADPIAIVAAENFYGNVAKQIGGDHVTVTSILENPAQDPHLFEATPSVARAVADAAIVIRNGLGYDPWMVQLMDASPDDALITIDAGALSRHDGSNPHVWFLPKTMSLVAQTLAATLAETDAAHGAEFMTRHSVFAAEIDALEDRIAGVRDKFGGTPVAATEPVANLLLDAMGLAILEQRFQTAVMNDTEPSISDVAQFESDLKANAIKVLVVNGQVSDPVAERLAALARENGIAVVDVTETMPEGLTYQAWMDRQISAIETALAGAGP